MANQPLTARRPDAQIVRSLFCRKISCSTGEENGLAAHPPPAGRG